MVGKRIHPIPSVTDVRAVFEYRPLTGEFLRRAFRGRPCALRAAGFVHKDGYRYVSLNGRLELVHRLAWLMQTGEWPALYVDHENGDRSDIRWENLRLATPLESSRNAAAHCDGVAGLRGVTASKGSGRWTAKAQIGGRYRHLGTFNTKEEARAAYLTATVPVFGEFVRFNNGEEIAR